jgi:hypothetical protein
MRGVAALGAVVVVLGACTGDGDSSTVTPSPRVQATVETTATASPTPGVVRTPSATATAEPAPYAGLYIVEVATGEWHTLAESARENVAGWWEPGGEAVTGWSGDGGRVTSFRFDLDGQVLEGYSDRFYVTPSPDGRSRYYYRLLPDGSFSSAVLEHDGVEVPIHVDFGFVRGFSSDGERLLVGRLGSEETPGRVGVTYWVVDVATGETLVEFAGSDLPAGSDDVMPARWSPSGSYVATAGLDGLLVHDAVDGTTTRLGAAGSTRWAPAKEQLVVETDGGGLEIVTMLPEFQRLPLETEGGRLVGRFGLWGGVVAVRSFLDPERFEEPIVRVYEEGSGRLLARWEGGVDTRTDQFIRYADGLAGVVLGPVDGCETFRYYSPLAAEEGRCLDGYNPRLPSDGRQIAYFGGPVDGEVTLVVYDVAADEERALGTIEVGGELPVARWNEAGTHLLVQRSWDGIGFSDELP